MPCPAPPPAWTTRRSRRQPARRSSGWCARSPLALLLAALAPLAAAQSDAALPLQLVPRLSPPPSGSAALGNAPVYLRADQLAGQLQAEVAATGATELRHAGIVIRADQLRFDQAEDRAFAEGRVRISFQGTVVHTPQLQLQLQRLEGFALAPRYELAATGGAGSAERIDFLGQDRARATRADYSTCTRDGGQTPDWLISAEELHLDFDAGVGVAEDARLQLFGTTVLRLPSMSFPLDDRRKSGWLAPTMQLTTGSGVELAVPYYWNIAPNRDATLTPSISTRRGFALGAELRYLEPSFAGTGTLDLLPNDRVAERTRWWTTWEHQGRLPADLRYGFAVERVSDDEWWNDFPRRHRALTPRLLPLVAQVERDFEAPAARGQLYLRTQRWQLLQAPNTMQAPFDRSLQLGVQGLGELPAGLRADFEAEANRFQLPSSPGYLPPLAPPSDGLRLHALGRLSRPWREAGWWLTPSLLFNAAAYHTDEPMADGRNTASRVIPTASLGGGAAFERSTELFGRALQQTLEPRLLYVYTPYVAQAQLPNFDSAIKDFSFASIFSENAFSGVDRVSDSNALTAGLTTRLLDAGSGVELLQLGIVQRYLFRDQQITESGLTEQRGYSDVLLRGATSVLQPLNLEAALRWSPNGNDFERAIVGLQYAPRPFRTLNLTYRYARDVTSQYELSWQWPLYEPDGRRPAPDANASCSSAWYTVGRVNYSNNDHRVTDSIVGLEFEAGCWIARLAVSRWSTGLSQANTQVVFQVELNGLSRVGSSALGILRDNIPGYRPLREGRGTVPASAYFD